MPKCHSNRSAYTRKLQLPPPGTLRWGVRRKMAVVTAIEAGTITRGEACSRYLLSTEELAAWEGDLAKYGSQGLLLKTLQRRRHARHGRHRKR